MTTRPEKLPDPGRKAIEDKSRPGLDNRPAIRDWDRRWALGGIGVNPNDPSAGAPPPPKYRPLSAASLKYGPRADTITRAILERGNSAAPAIHDPKLQAYEIRRERMIDSWTLPRKFNADDNMTDRLMVKAPAAVLEKDDAPERAVDRQFGEILTAAAEHIVARVRDLTEERMLRYQREHPAESLMTLERADRLAGRHSFAVRRRRWQASAYR